VGSYLIRYEDNKVILSGNTTKAFLEKMNNPNKETLMKRNAYLKQIQRSLSVKKVDGKIIIK
jgi:hypothetical protein